MAISELTEGLLLKDLGTILLKHLHKM